ncbi:hypothetical protein ABDJ41_19900 [Pedobacter sp. ASV1-7]|uniref:hypothetical protein n=1 Tax=Pedobacter sp. ASV1-7 TaxID=3145237 RepID=UPI0032E934BD
MSEKKIKTKGATIVLDPSIKEFSIVLGERFFFNFDSQQFEIDTNPYGDPRCVPIFDLIALNNGLQFTSQRKSIIIASSFPIDRAIINEMLLLNANEIRFAENDTTKIEISLEKGVLKSIRLIKIVDYSSIDFLTLLFEKEQSFVIKYPFQKLPLNSFYFEGNSIVCQSTEETIMWAISLPQTVINGIKNIVLFEA